MYPKKQKVAILYQQQGLTLWGPLLYKRYFIVFWIKMHYTIIVWSHRADAQSAKVATYIQTQLTKMNKKNIVTIISLQDNPLPLRSDCMRSKEPQDEYQMRAHVWDPMAQKLQQAEAIIIIAPEWSGMAPAWLKNFFLYCNTELIGNKAALLVGVSSWVWGAYPIAELRMSSYKNNHLCYIPQHIIVRSVTEVLNDDTLDETTTSRDSTIKKRMHYSLQVLEQYALALNAVRASGVIDIQTYPYGM